MILIVGGGHLGSYLFKIIKERTQEDVLITVRDIERKKFFQGADCICCDVSSEDDLKKIADKCAEKSVDIFYFAACHNVDYVYENPEKAREINIFALENFLKVLPNIRRLIFASTDCVYGEDNSVLLKEYTLLRPVNEYGKQKVEAEKVVLKYGFTCARLPFMLGPSIIEKPHFYDNVCYKIRNFKEVEMIDGMVRSVLSYEDVAKILFRLMKIEGEIPKIINIAGDKAYSKYDVGLIIAENNSADLSLIKKISEEEAHKFFKDKRASSSVMDNSLLKNILNVSEIKWEEDLC